MLKPPKAVFSKYFYMVLLLFIGPKADGARVKQGLDFGLVIPRLSGRPAGCGFTVGFLSRSSPICSDVTQLI